MYVSPEGNFPRYLLDIKLQHPDWKEGQPLPTGWRKVEESPLPSLLPNQYIEEGHPVEVEGNLVRSFIVKEKTPLPLGESEIIKILEKLGEANLREMEFLDGIERLGAKYLSPDNLGVEISGAEALAVLDYLGYPIGENIRKEIAAITA